MAFLCPSRLGKAKNKRGYYDSMMGRITGSDSIETLVKLELGKQNANNPETRRIILQSFTGYAPEEVTVKQGQKVNILFREGDWAYVITHDKKEGYVPFTYCARIGKPPSYRAPKLNKDKEKLLVTENVDVNGNDNEVSLEEIDTTLAETNDESYFSGIISDSFVSDEWLEQSCKEHPSTDSGFERQIKITDNPETDKTLSETIPAHINGHVLTDSLKAGHTDSEVVDQSINFKAPKEDILSEQKMISFDKVPLGRFLVLYDFVGYYEDDASVRQADIVTVLNAEDSDWFWVRKTDNSEGFVPSNFLFRLGLMFPETKQPAILPLYENVGAFKNGIYREEPNLRRSPALHIHEVSPSKTEAAEMRSKFDVNQQYVSSPLHRTEDVNFSESVGSTWQSVKSPQNIWHQSSSPRTSHTSKQHHRFSCDVGAIMSSQTHTESHTRFIEHLTVNGDKELDNKINDSTTEKLYPPPLEFSNEAANTNEAIHEITQVKKTKVSLSLEGNEKCKTAQSSHPSHVRYISQPSDCFDVGTTNAIKRPEINQQQMNLNHSCTEVKYRNNPAKNRARPKSTPPALSSYEDLLHASQYYMGGHNHYDPPQTAARISGHQSERLTPRTNYNYSPTSVWKPYLQSNIDEKDIFTESETSAFEKPVSRNTDNTLHSSKHENQVAANVYKSNQFDKYNMHEIPYYPSGVYNIRSTTDNNLQNVQVHKTIRTLSDKENQALYRKLDNIQNSFDSNDSNPEEKVYINKNDTVTGKNAHKSESKNNGTEKEIPSRRQDPALLATQTKYHSKYQTDTHESSTNQEHQVNGEPHHTKSSNSSYIANESRTSSALNQLGNKLTTTPNPAAGVSTFDNPGKIKCTDNQTPQKRNCKGKTHTEPTVGKFMEHNSNQKAADRDSTNVNRKLSSEKSKKRTTEFVSQFDYKATSKTALPLQRGEVIQVSMEDQTDKHWYWAYSPKLRRHGYVPRNYVQVPQITII